MFWENSIETSILSRVKQITSPGWMHEASAQVWCTGKTQRDGMGREVGGGIRMGNTCKSMADSCQCMAKPLQYCKVISFQLIKISEKKKKIQGRNVLSSKKDLGFMRLEYLQACWDKSARLVAYSRTDISIHLCWNVFLYSWVHLALGRGGEGET